MSTDFVQGIQYKNSGQKRKRQKTQSHEKMEVFSTFSSFATHNNIKEIKGKYYYIYNFQK